MTTLDLVVAALVVLGALVGLWFGAWKQITHFAAWLAGAAAAYFLAGPVAQELEKPLDAPYFLTFALSTVALFVLAYLVARLAFALPGWMRKKDEGSATEKALTVLNRVGGALIGAAKWAFYAWVLLSVATLIPPLAKRLRESAFAGLAQRHNVVEWAFRERVDSLRKALDSKGKSKGSELQRLPRDPRFAAIAKNAPLREAIVRGDVQAIASSPELVGLLNDREAMAELVAAVSRASGEITGTLKQ